MKLHLPLALCAQHETEYIQFGPKGERYILGQFAQSLPQCTSDGCTQRAGSWYLDTFYYPPSAQITGALGGTKGGSSTSSDKVAAARANGAKGGRPKSFKVWLQSQLLYSDLLSWINENTAEQMTEGGHEIFPYLRADVTPGITYMVQSIASENMQIKLVESFQHFCHEHEIAETTDYKVLQDDYALDVAPLTELVVVRPGAGDLVETLLKDCLKGAEEDGRPRKIMMPRGGGFVLIEQGMSYEEAHETFAAKRINTKGITLSVPNPMLRRD